MRVLILTVKVRLENSIGVKVILQLGLALCVGTGVVTQTIPALRRQRHNWGLRGRNQKPHKLNAWTLDITNATR